MLFIKHLQEGRSYKLPSSCLKIEANAEGSLADVENIPGNAGEKRQDELLHPPSKFLVTSGSQVAV